MRHRRAIHSALPDDPEEGAREGIAFRRGALRLGDLLRRCKLVGLDDGLRKDRAGRRRSFLRLARGDDVDGALDVVVVCKKEDIVKMRPG